jgi:hypothetical protein
VRWWALLLVELLAAVSGPASDVADAILWFTENSLRRDRVSPGVRTYNLSEDDAATVPMARSLNLPTRLLVDSRWRVVPLPSLAEWLWVILRSRWLIFRQPFGLMLFSGAKLQETGYEFRFGMSTAIAEFRRGLASDL